MSLSSESAEASVSSSASSSSRRRAWRISLLPPGQINPQLRQFHSDWYVAGASFDHIIRLEAFGFKLTRVCLEGLLDFEVRFRAAVAHTLAVRDVSAHTRVDCLDQRMCSRPTKTGTKFEAWSKTCEGALAAAAEDEEFIVHHLLYIYAAVLAFMLRVHVAETNWQMTFKTQAKKLDLTLHAPDGTIRRLA